MEDIPPQFSGFLTSSPREKSHSLKALQVQRKQRGFLKGGCKQFLTASLGLPLWVAAVPREVLCYERRQKSHKIIVCWEEASLRVVL